MTPFPDARQRAADAAAGAGVVVETVDEPADLEELGAVFSGIWGRGAGGDLSVNLLKALAHSGHYISAARHDGRVIGGAVGFAHAPGAGSCLHSHIAGVRPDLQGKGIGYAIKLDQGAWALERGIPTVTWTFDPLVRRNAWFNLAKLGAVAATYHRNFYGTMDDGINAGDESDRCFAVWDPAHRAARPEEPTGVRILETAADGGPRATGRPAGGGAPMLCQVPDDIVELRRRSPDLARRWRLALRETMGAAMESGYRATAMSADAFYLLEIAA